MEPSSRSANIQITGILDKEKYKNKDVFFNLFFDYLFLYMLEISRIKNLRQLKMFEKNREMPCDHGIKKCRKCIS